jgi:hypothetical protein
MIKKFESFVNEELHKRNNDNEYIGYVVVNYSDGSVLSHYSIDDDFNDAIEEVTELSRKDKYGTYLVCGVCKDNTYSSDIDDENNTIVYNTDEPQISEMNNKNSFDELNESFTNQELKDAIKAHGGLTVNKHFYDDARTSLADFDLKNAKFVGYLKPETVDDIYNNNCYILLYKSRDIILRTNDGGIILVEKGNSVLDKNYDVWVRKVKTRNNNWIEDRVRKHPEEEYWNSSKVDIKYDSLKPEKHATYMRRKKPINRK